MREFDWAVSGQNFERARGRANTAIDALVRVGRAAPVTPDVLRALELQALGGVETMREIYISASDHVLSEPLRFGEVSKQ